MQYAAEPNISRQELNRLAWMEYTSGQDVTSPPREEVIKAWDRCSALDVNPNQKSVPNMLSPEALEALRLRNKFFLDVSRPTLEDLYNFVADSQFILALSDKDGYLLEVFGDDEMRDSVKAGNWRPGVQWSEQNAGNNVIGTTISQNKPVMLVGYEHYCRCSHYYGAAGAPIHNVSGETIGVIALCCKYEAIHPHTLGMVVAAANSIEGQFSMKAAWDKSEIADQYKEKVINAINDGVIGADTSGNITFCNDKALEMLAVPREKLLALNLRDMMEPALLASLRASSGINDTEMIFKLGQAYIKCIGTSRHITNNGAFEGIVIVLREYWRAAKLADKLLMKDVKWTFERMVGRNPRFLFSVKVARTAAATESSVLITGESGTGKDLIAQSIHNASRRANGPYVALNCAAIPKDLIVSELFGYSEGAFTGAKKGGNKGKFELASGGTIFLDEIGEMPLEQQTVLLRVLEDKAITRIGGSECIPFTGRIIAATNKDLRKEVEARRFRQDLYYRLNVFTVEAVPLRERKDDIEPLAREYLGRLAVRMGTGTPELSREALDILMDYDWPGNIRELQNVLERALMLSGGMQIWPRFIMLPNNLLREAPAPSAPESAPAEAAPPDAQHKLESFEAQLIRDALARCRGNVTHACAELNISRTTLYRKAARFGITIR